jgi:hypothetical protein
VSGSGQRARLAHSDFWLYMGTTIRHFNDGFYPHLENCKKQATYRPLSAGVQKTGIGAEV